MTLSCELPGGFTNALEDVSDDHSVDLFQPAFSIDKDGDTLSKVRSEERFSRNAETGV